MRERRSIVEQWQQGRAAAHVTLIRVEGSSYRRPGARLLVLTDGTSVGSISGGCLEAELARKARWTIRNGPVVERFSTVFDDTEEIPYGLGCGGTLDLLIEPVETAGSRGSSECDDRIAHRRSSQRCDMASGKWKASPACHL